jgi:penicillin-binding protein 1A
MFLAVAAGVAWYIGDVSKDLPDYEVLNSYEPPVTTRVHAASGELMAEYARERRLFLPIQAIPDRVKAAFLSAEDKNFYHHPGVDPVGLARAIVTNIQNMGTGRRPVGASTITQQVAKNFLLSADQTIDRKVKEAILSFRIEQAYSKDRILELYLNEIFFGQNAYGIAGAALIYFNKSVNELTIAETAYLAALPKAPNNYHPFRQTERAIERRNWVIDRMIENGYVSAERWRGGQAAAAGRNVPRRSVVPIFSRPSISPRKCAAKMIDRYGNDALYEGGLSVRTTLDPRASGFGAQGIAQGPDQL